MAKILCCDDKVLIFIKSGLWYFISFEVLNKMEERLSLIGLFVNYGEESWDPASEWGTQPQTHA